MTDAGQVTAQDAEVMRYSEDGRELQRAAVAFAQERSPNAISFLLQCLLNEGFLGRLDTPESYQQTFNMLRLARVVRNLMDNRIPEVDRLLLSLTGSPLYRSNALRIQLLIRALAVIQPSPDVAIAYWRMYAEPGGVLVYDVVEALCDNRSDPAIALLEQVFANPAHDRFEKQSWMREIILPIRDDPRIVLMCEKLVRQVLEAQLKVDLLEVMFDYQPDDWYIECEPPVPQSRTDLQDAVRVSLTNAGNFGLQMPEVPAPLREKIQSVLDDFREETT